MLMWSSKQVACGHKGEDEGKEKEKEKEWKTQCGILTEHEIQV